MLHNKGFTLIELLVAIMVMAIMAVMSYRAVDSMITVEQRLAKEISQWRELLLFFDRFENDIKSPAPYEQEIGMRHVLAKISSSVPGQQAPDTPQNDAIEAPVNVDADNSVKIGWQKSMWQGRNQKEENFVEFLRMPDASGYMQRIGYRFIDNEIRLVIWPQAFAVNSIEPNEYVILRNVEALDVQFARNLAWSDNYQSDTKIKKHWPKVVKLTVTLKNQEPVERLFTLP